MELLNIWLLTIPGATLVADLRKKCRNLQEPVQALRALLLERARNASPTDKASVSSDFEYFLNAGPEMPIKKVAFDDFIREVWVASHLLFYATVVAGIHDPSKRPPLYRTTIA